MRPVVITLALGAALFNAVASVLQRSAARLVPPGASSSLRLIEDLVKRPAWLLGITAMVGAFMLQGLALAHGQLSVVQPLLVTELLFVFAIRATLLGQPYRVQRWLGALVAVAGLVVFLEVAAPRGGTALPSSTALAMVAMAVALVILVMVAAARQGPPARRAALLGAASGTSFALTAGLIKLMASSLASHGIAQLVLTWPPYAVSVAGAGSVILAGHAFHAGPLFASQSSLTLVDPLASILIGMGLLGEHLRTAPAALGVEGIALCLMVLGVMVLGSSSRSEPRSPRAAAPRGAFSTAVRRLSRDQTARSTELGSLGLGRAGTLATAAHRLRRVTIGPAVRSAGEGAGPGRAIIRPPLTLAPPPAAVDTGPPGATRPPRPGPWTLLPQGMTSPAAQAAS